jgi:hypothetical protein
MIIETLIQQLQCRLQRFLSNPSARRTDGAFFWNARKIMIVF